MLEASYRHSAILLRAHTTQYYEVMVKNPLYTLGDPIESTLFTEKLDAFLRTLPFYN